MKDLGKREVLFKMIPGPPRLKTPTALGTYCRQPLAHKEPVLWPHLLSDHPPTRDAHFIQIL